MINFFILLRNYISESINDILISPRNNIKALDGLRSLAIILVVCFHVNELFVGNDGYHVGILNALPPFRGGWVGVQLFFVLSGFLIGGQLWKELSARKNIAFFKFILRRGFRIWPLYYAVLAMVYFLSLNHESDSRGLISNILFLGNYISDNGPIIGSWSLATEEQFYIIAPLFLITINKFFPNKNLSYYRKILFCMFFVPIITRYITWDIFLNLKKFDLNAYMRHIYRPFHTNSEGLIAGMIISNYHYDKDNILKKYSRNPYVIVPAIILFIVSFYSKVYISFTGVVLGFSVLLVYCLKNKGRIIDLLSNKFLFLISKTSFAIYLVHTHVINNLMSVRLVRSLSFGVRDLEILGAFIYVMITSFLISILLYALIEKPFMLLRGKIFVKHYTLK